VDDIKIGLKKLNWRLWTGFVWLSIGINGRLLRTRKGTFGFHKMRGISWLDDDRWASQEDRLSRQAGREEGR
jgi:hypothetical protein